MPSRWEVRLPGVDPATVTPQRLHAVVSGWFDTCDGAHQQKSKGYSAAVRPASDGAAVAVGLVDDTLVERLYSGAGRGRRVRVGSHTVILEADPCQTHGTPWAQLWEAGTAAAWGLRMYTPTTFRRGDAFTPNPGLRAILGGLRRTWREFAPADTPPLVLDLTPEPVWLTDIAVTSTVVRVNGRVVSGFTGRLRFACDAGPAVAAAVDRLVRLAPYSGVGAYTGWGFGAVRLDRARHAPARPGEAPSEHAPHSCVRAPGRRPAETTWAGC